MIHSSDRMKSYVEMQIDPFFLDRLNQNLPTILVFKFDIRKEIGNIEESFGTAINSIINDNSTCLIPLCQLEE